MLEILDKELDILAEEVEGGSRTFDIPPVTDGFSRTAYYSWSWVAQDVGRWRRFNWFLGCFLGVVEDCWIESFILK